MYNDNAGTDMAPERIDIGANAPESLPSLGDFAAEPGGAWPKGWYGATIIEGYSTNSGHTFSTEDKPSKQGDSRNLIIAVKMDGGKLGTRTTFTQLNYRLSDFTPDRLAAVKVAREEFRAVKGKWIGNEDLQRSSLALAQLGQLESALGFRIPMHPMGHINAIKLVSQNMDVRLGEDDKGYNVINSFAKMGTRAKK